MFLRGRATEDREGLRRERHYLAIVQELLVFGEVERIAFEAQEPISIHRGPGEPRSDGVLTAN